MEWLFNKTFKSLKKEPKDFDENKEVAQKGCKVAKAARMQLEKSTGKKVISKQNVKSSKSTNEKELKE